MECLKCGKITVTMWRVTEPDGVKIICSSCIVIWPPLKPGQMFSLHEEIRPVDFDSWFESIEKGIEGKLEGE